MVRVDWRMAPVRSHVVREKLEWISSARAMKRGARAVWVSGLVGEIGRRRLRDIFRGSTDRDVAGWQTNVRVIGIVWRSGREKSWIIGYLYICVRALCLPSWTGHASLPTLDGRSNYLAVFRSGRSLPFSIFLWQFECFLVAFLKTQAVERTISSPSCSSSNCSTMLTIV